MAIYEVVKHSWEMWAELELAPGKQVAGAMRIMTQDPGAAIYGAFVEIEGDRLAMVSTFANSVHLFEHNERDWVYRYMVTPGPGYGYDFQCRTVALSGNSLLIGSPGELGGGNLFVFELRE